MKVLVVYPGRFQPFHKGHAQVYKWLKSKFGDAVIATSDKVELPKSPFNFKEKVKMMTLAGVPSNSIKQVTNPYIAREILKDYDPKTTVLVFAVSQKDMEEDPRFSFKPTKSGKPGYLQPYAGNEKNLQPFGDATMPKGYVIVTPTFTFDVLGKPATSASELRKQFVSLDNAKQKEFVKDLFGKYDASVHKLLSAKLPKPKTLKQLKEEITRKELAPMLDSFVSFASDKLGLKSMPTVRYKTDDDSYNSFAAYNPASNELSISTLNRHPMDIFRSVAHELVHHKQNEDGRLGKDIEKEGATGSDIENEANSEAGKIMRWFAKANPDMFGKSYVVEFTIQGSKTQKDTVQHISNVQKNKEFDRQTKNHLKWTDRLNRNRPATENPEPNSPYNNVDPNRFKSNTIRIKPKNFHKQNQELQKNPPKPIVETNTAAIGGGIRGLGNVTGEVSPTGVSQYVITNQTSGLWYDDGIDRYWLDKKGSSEYQKKATKSFKSLRENLNEGINDPGKLKAIFLAGGPGSGKDYVMNSTLAGEGLKEINSDVAFEYLMQKNGLDLEMPDEERVERDIVRGRAKNITKEQERLALAGRLGLIINGTADDLEKIKTIKQNLEADGYETMMVFVNTSNEVSRERNVERGKMGKRKVPDGTDKQGVPDNSPNIRQQKWDLAQKNIGELQKIFGNERFAVIDNTADVRKVGPEEKEKIQANFNRIRRMAQQFVRSENQNPAAAKWIEREARNRGITGYQEPKRYKTLTQIRQNVEMPSVIHKPDNDLMNQARRLGLSYYGFGRFGRKINGVNKVLYHSQGGKLVKVQLSEDLRNWFSKTHPEGNWKRVDTKGNIKGDCAREPGEGKPKCMPASRAYSMSQKERAASARRKRREDPVADRSGKGNKPIMVKTESVQKAIDKINRDRMSEQVLMEKNKPTNPELWSRAKSLARKKFDVYPSAYANGWAAKWYKSKGGGWTSVNEEKGTCWDGYEQKGMKKKGNRMVPNCVPVNEAFESFVAESKKKTPWQKMVKALPHLEKNAEEAKKAKEELMHSADKLKQEAMEASVQGGYAFGADGIGPTIGVPRAGTPYGFGYGSAYSMGLSESIQKWMSKESTQQKYMEKYGELWEEKLVETALKLENAGCGCEHSEEKKSVKKLREGMEGGVNNMSPIPTQRKGNQEVDEEKSPAWTRKEGQNPKGGLNRRGIESYRRANPGSKLSMAVTTKPSKLKKGSKAANRRKSFCARMGGMKKRLTSAKTARDPNSRINKALRKWNCEE